MSVHDIISLEVTTSKPRAKPLSSTTVYYTFWTRLFHRKHHFITTPGRFEFKWWKFRKVDAAMSATIGSIGEMTWSQLWRVLTIFKPTLKCLRHRKKASFLSIGKDLFHVTSGWCGGWVAARRWRSWRSWRRGNSGRCQGWLPNGRRDRLPWLNRQHCIWY